MSEEIRKKLLTIDGRQKILESIKQAMYENPRLGNYYIWYYGVYDLLKRGLHERYLEEIYTQMLRSNIIQAS